MSLMGEYFDNAACEIITFMRRWHNGEVALKQEKTEEGDTLWYMVDLTDY